MVEIGRLGYLSVNRLIVLIRCHQISAFKYFILIQLGIFFLFSIYSFYHSNDKISNLPSNLQRSKENTTQIQIRLIAWDEQANKKSFDISGALEGSDLVIREGNTFNVNTSSLRLECVSKVPVTWSYNGLGIPDFQSLSHFRITTTNFSDESNNKFKSLLDFGKPSLNEYDTGKYTCHSFNDIHKVAISNHFYIFVPGSEVMLGRGGNNLQEIFYDQIRDGSIATIPCVVSDPSIVLELYYKNNTNPLTISESISFDPKAGFLVTISDNYNPWGTYVCKYWGSGNATKSSFFKLTKAIRKIPVLIEPKKSSIIGKGSMPTLFECQAAEELQISFPVNYSKPIIADEVLDNKTKKGLGFNYKASFIATPWNHGVWRGKRLIQIECKRKKDGLVLHTWEYSVPKFGELIAEFNLTFDPPTHQFTCCPNPHSSSLLKLTQCSSISECDLRSKSSRPFVNIPSQVYRGCAKWMPTKALSFGIVQCSSGRDSEQILMYLDKNRINWIKPNSFENNNIKDLHLQKVSTSPSHEFVILECKASSFNFAGGLKWTTILLPSKSNSTNIPMSKKEVLEGIRRYDERFEPPFYTSTAYIIKRNDRTISISCHAPVLTSSKWKSIKFNVKPTLHKNKIKS